MATLTGQAVQDRYKDYCQVSNSNSGIDATKRPIEDGEGTASKLELSTTVVNVISGFELNDVSAQTGTVLKHEVGGLEFDASAIADGGIVVGTASGTMAIRASALTAGAAGFVKHELGGLEFDASAIADGGMVVGTASGTMAIRTTVFTAGAAGFLTHEVGGIEADISAITTDRFLVGTSSGVIGIRTAAQARTHLALGTSAVIDTGTATGKVPLVGTTSATDTLAGLAETATQAAQETGSATDKMVTPGRQQFHPSAAKGWVKFSVGAVSAANYNVASITDTAAGDWTVNWATDFSSANYAVSVTALLTATDARLVFARAQAAGTTRIQMSNTSASLTETNASDIFVTAFGDQ